MIQGEGFPVVRNPVGLIPVAPTLGGGLWQLLFHMLSTQLQQVHDQAEYLALVADAGQLRQEAAVCCSHATYTQDTQWKVIMMRRLALPKQLLG